MSSGERAKPPATFEERNPFDISRRSGPEVAAEIAKRMAAWKQARTRTAAPSIASSGTDAAQPPIAAPVQPARMPKPAAPAAQPAPVARGAKGAAPRVPYFASASATRRAMPPAPSLKQSSAPSQPAADEEIAERVDEPAIPAPALPQDPPRHDSPDVADAVTKPEAPLAEAAAAAVEAAPSDIVDPVESAPAAETFEPTAAEPDDTERRRAEARALKARWIAARDLDALVDDPAARVDGGHPPAAEAHETAKAEEMSALAMQADLAVAESDRLGGTADDAAREAAAPVEEPAPEIPTVARASSMDAPIEAGRSEPTFDAPVTAPVAGGDVEAPASDLAAPDGVAGRKEPTFDAPAVPAVPDVHEVVREPDVAPQEDMADEGPSIAALDEVAGRKEPTFDPPVQREAHEVAAAAAARVDADSIAEQPVATPALAPEDSASADKWTTAEASQLSIAALDEAVGRKEPTFDEPALPTKPTAAPATAPRITLRPIETRIEARRVDTLRAEPQLSIRRPIFPRIEREDWDVPPMVAARASRTRHGTGWAIGLGSVLLIAGITAPAAIWQQGRQVQDQVALVSPAPPPQRAPAPTVRTTEAPAPATLPEPPQPAPSSAAPKAAAPAAVAAEETKTSAAQPEAEQAAADAKSATTLGTIGDGGTVADAPVIAPPPPAESPASPVGAPRASAAMVARPFVPEQGDGPFLRPPTTGAASVPVAGAPVQSAAVGVKPNLMVVLKPKQPTRVSAAKPVAGKPKPVVRKAKPFFQQSPDQMFETLIDTLSGGQPVNPANKPVSPSTRR